MTSEAGHMSQSYIHLRMDPIQKPDGDDPLHSTQQDTFQRIAKGSKSTKEAIASPLADSNASTVFQATRIALQHAISGIKLFRRPCCICPVHRESSFQERGSTVLTETTLLHLREYASFCPFCHVLYQAVIKYPLSTRPFDRLLRGHMGSDWRNKVVVTQGDDYVKVHIAAQYDDDVRSDALFLHVEERCGYKGCF